MRRVLRRWQHIQRQYGPVPQNLENGSLIDQPETELAPEQQRGNGDGKTNSYGNVKGKVLPDRAIVLDSLSTIDPSAMKECQRTSGEPPTQLELPVMI